MAWFVDKENDAVRFEKLVPHRFAQVLRFWSYGAAIGEFFERSNGVINAL